MAQNVETVKTLVVDDTAFMRRALVKILSDIPNIEVAGVAKHGKEAIEALEVINPDVITMDVDMPVMDGLTAIKHIMVRGPRPVVMVSGLAGHGTVSLEAMKLGAVDFFPKPSGTISLDIDQSAEELGRVVKQASMLNPWGIIRANVPSVELHDTMKNDRALGVAVVVAQQGACGTLIRLLGNVQPALPVTIIAVQDIYKEVLDPFSRELNRVLPWQINAGRKERIVGGSCLLASCQSPWYLHKSESGASATTGPNRCVDDLLEEAAHLFGRRCLAAVIGGISEEGVKGLAAVQSCGGTSLVLSPEACVYGETSRAAMTAGAAEVVDSEQGLWTRLEAFGRRLLLEGKISA